MSELSLGILGHLFQPRSLCLLATDALSALSMHERESQCESRLQLIVILFVTISYHTRTVSRLPNSHHSVLRYLSTSMRSSERTPQRTTARSPSP